MCPRSRAEIEEKIKLIINSFFSMKRKAREKNLLQILLFFLGVVLRPQGKDDCDARESIYINWFSCRELTHKLTFLKMKNQDLLMIHILDIYKSYHYITTPGK